MQKSGLHGNQRPMARLGIRVTQLMNCRRWISGRIITFAIALLWLVAIFSTRVLSHHESYDDVIFKEKWDNAILYSIVRKIGGCFVSGKAKDRPRCEY
jgi:hypothetical protein